MAALIPLFVPQFLKVRRLVKRRNPRIAALFQGLRHFSRENVARFVKLRHIGKNRGTFGKKCRNTLPAQIQRQTIKVWHMFLSKSDTQNFNWCCVLLDIYHILTEGCPDFRGVLLVSFLRASVSDCSSSGVHTPSSRRGRRPAESQSPSTQSPQWQYHDCWSGCVRLPRGRVVPRPVGGG